MADVDPDSYRRRWQQRLLPFMARMLAGLAVFFLLASLGQLIYLHQRIQVAPQLPASSILRENHCPAGWASESCLQLRRYDTSALLEADTVARRYHQANVVLMSSVWSRYLGFVTGMILAIVGAVFILGQVETTNSELGGSGAGWTLSLRSASPGLVLCVLGVALMITTIVTLHEIHTRDVAVYVGGSAADAGGPLPRIELAAPKAVPPVASSASR